MALPLLEERDPAWASCRYLTASVLPVRVACDLSCPFCFSRSSVSALRHDTTDLLRLDVAGFYRASHELGARRLVITGGGEPLLRPEVVVSLVALGRRHFDEVALFTNGTRLTKELSARLADAGLSYLCWSRHAPTDEGSRRLMGEGAPGLEGFFAAAEGLKVRATCVMLRGEVDGREAAFRYMDALRPFGVQEFTFKHTYVAYETSVFQGSEQDRWARAHQIEADPFEGLGVSLGSLPWGPVIRQMEELRVCYYREPTPAWELQNRIGRSTNLLSDGSVYGSLEDRRSLLFRLTR